MKLNVFKVRFSLLLIIIFPLFSTSSIAQNINSIFEKAPAFDQGFSGLYVKDLKTGEVIYERMADKYFTPASNIKLFTFYTGLKILGDSIPALKYWTKDDALIFTGTGDPSFLNPELPVSNVFEFLKDGPDKLYYLPSTSSDEPYGPGWAWDDYNSSYSPERADFPIYGNLVTFSFFSNRKPPFVTPGVFKDSIKVREFDGTIKPGINRDLNTNIFRYQNIEALPKYHAQKLPFKYSHELMVKLLKDTLNKEIEIVKALPKDTGDASIIYSLPSDTLYKRMLQESDNFIAEQLLILSAQKNSGSPKADNIINYMQKNYLKDLPDKAYWVDGSGLSRYNLVTPRSMVKLLEKIYEEVPQERLFELLAIGGKAGTIKYNYWAPEPYIFAKTGTLLHNHSMSGYLTTRSGKVLAFSFMNSNYPVPTREIRQQMEVILREIYKNY